jgi:hypothetical protein
MGRLLLALGLAVGILACEEKEPTDPIGEGACRRSTQRTPTDAEMRACFAQRSASLQRLVALIQSERVEVVGTDKIGNCWNLLGRWGCGGDMGSVLAKNGLSRKRYDDYLRAFKSVGAYRATRQRDGSVEVSVFRAGIIPSGVSKNFLWSPSRMPSPLVPDTDLGRLNRFYTSHAALGSGWYIEHMSN